MWKDIVNLIYTVKGKDADGFITETEVKTEVYANKKSVSRTEYYKAMEIGMQPECIFEMYSDDYKLSEHEVSGKKRYADFIEHDGIKYTIGRTYEKTDGKLEVTCYG